jgi:hypothetical protein
VTGAAAGNSFTLQVPDDEVRHVGLARAWKRKATVPSAAPSDETATPVASVGAQLGATVLGVGADLQHDERARGQVVGGAGASTHGLWRMAPIDGPSSTLVPLRIRRRPSSTLVPLRIRRRLHGERDHREDSVCELVLRQVPDDEAGHVGLAGCGGEAAPWWSGGATAVLSVGSSGKAVQHRGRGANNC